MDATNTLSTHLGQALFQLSPPGPITEADGVASRIWVTRKIRAVFHDSPSFVGPIWGPYGADRVQVGPKLAHELCYLGHICNTRSRWAKPYSNQEYPCIVIHIITAYTYAWLWFLESFLCDHARLHHRNVYIRMNLDLARAIDDWRELRAWYICTSTMNHYQLILWFLGVYFRKPPESILSYFVKTLPRTCAATNKVWWWAPRRHECWRMPASFFAI